MSNASIGTCEFCSKENVVVISTSATDSYCKDCIKIVIEECKEALKEIAKFEKTNNVRKVKSNKCITEEELTELEIKKDEALAQLMSGSYGGVRKL